MSLNKQAAYVRHQLGNSHHESICTTCFLTAARGATEQELEPQESAHTCGSHLKAGCNESEQADHVR